MRNTLFALILMSLVACNSSNNVEVLKTKKGYSYEIHKGSGTKSADTTDFLIFDYKFFGDDTLLIEDSKNMPTEPAMQVPRDVATNDNVHPLMEISRGLSAGDSVVLRMPIDSIPGAKAQFPNVQEVSYRLKVNNVMSEEEYKTMMEEKQKARMAAAEKSRARIPEVDALVRNLLAKNKKGKLETKDLPSGLQIHIIEEGSGAKINAGENASVHYYGALKSDGSNFDTSFKRGDRFTFNVGKGMVIKGWDEGLQHLKHGDKAFLIIPAPLAYGERSPSPQIPANSDLVFYIEVE